MSASPASTFEVPRYGDDGLFPDRRGWLSAPITVMFWALIFTIVYFATRNVAIEDSVAADGYIAALLIAFIMVIFFAIPALTLTIGRYLDDGTSTQAPWRSGLTFAAVGLVLGAIPAVFIYLVNNAYGWLPFTQMIIPSTLAPWFARVVLDQAVTRRGLRNFVLAFTGVVVVGSLTIGVSVFTGHI